MNVQLCLAYEPPYQWSALRNFFGKRLIAGNEYISDDVFRKTLCIEQEAVRVHMRFVPEQSHFEVAFDQKFKQYEAHIVAMVSRILDLRASPKEIAQSLQYSGLKSHQIEIGMRIPGICSRFEAGVRAILGQQVSVAAAINQVNKLNSALSANAEAFVTPSAVVNSDLSCIKLPQARKNALSSFAKLMLQDPEADFDKWLAIKGIGPWTVNYVNLRASDNTDVWLHTDLVIRQRLKALSEQGQHINADKCAPWRSYLTFSLWNLSL